MALRTRVSNEMGFTLVELMVVVVIIAILITIGLVSLLGVRQRAQDRAAQAELATAVKAEVSIYVRDNEFTEDPAEMTAAESNLQYTVDASTGPSEISLYLPDGGQEVILGARSDSGTCFFLLRDANGPTGMATSAPGPCEPEAPEVVWESGW